MTLYTTSNNQSNNDPELNPYSSYQPPEGNNEPLGNQSQPHLTSSPQPPSNHSLEFQDFMRKHRTLSLITIIAIIIAIFSLAILAISHLLPPGPEVADPEVAPIPYFEHRYLLEYPLGPELANEVISEIGNLIISPEEISSAPEENPDSNLYTISLVESTYQSQQIDSDYLYQVDLELSDSRTYTLYVRTDAAYGKDYVTIVLDRTDSDSAQDHAIILTNNKDKFTSAQTNWIKSLPLTTPNLTIRNLPSQ